MSAPEIIYSTLQGFLYPTGTGNNCRPYACVIWTIGLIRIHLWPYICGMFYTVYPTFKTLTRLWFCVVVSYFSFFSWDVWGWGWGGVGWGVGSGNCESFTAMFLRKLTQKAMVEIGLYSTTKNWQTFSYFLACTVYSCFCFIPHLTAMMPSVWQCWLIKLLHKIGRHLNI